MLANTRSNRGHLRESLVDAVTNTLKVSNMQARKALGSGGTYSSKKLLTIQCLAKY